MTTTHTSAAAQAAPNLDNSIFTYREAANQNELEQLLRLRYACFTQGEWANYSLIQRNPYKMDIDAFDLKAIHIGVFAKQNGKEIPVGYARFVGESATKHSFWVKNILTKCPQLYLKKIYSGFPFIEKLGQREKCMFDDFLLKNKTYQTIEVSRVCVTAGFPSASLCQLLVMGNTVYSAGLNANMNVIFIIKDKMERVLARNGAKAIEGLTTKVFDMTFNAFYINQAMIPPIKQDQIKKMGQLFSKNNCIRFDKKEEKFF